MEVVEVREDASRQSGAIVRIDGYDYPTTVTSPFETREEVELDWYFEEHLRFPFTDRVRARQAGKSLKTYGEALFWQIIASAAAREAYGALKTRAYPDKVTIAIIGSPEFQGLHWEALKDPQLPHPFALDAPMVRRRLATAPAVEARAGASPTLNLLVVTARPAGAYDVGYRTITRPLLGALRQARLRVDVDFTRPGTWRALVEQLDGATREHGTGYYHAIHFDLHGRLLTYDDFQKRETGPTSTDKLTFRARWGRDTIARYAGVKAFLSFEPSVDDASGLAEAGEIADLLLKHKIPIAILNACQSGKQVGTEESALAARLLAAGTQSVLGMAWSVTVSAAERLVPTLYGELFAGHSLGSAVLAGRRSLHADKRRRAAFNEKIDLEDWLLPVVYQNREPVLSFRDFTVDEAARWYAAQAARSSDPEAEYGFFGRDLDVLRIETALLTKGNLLLVQGMGGCGKTTLLRHLMHWWELTGLVEGSFYFGWDERPWTRAHIIRTLARSVLPPDAARAFDKMGGSAQQQAIAAALRAKRYLLVLDNLESVTAEPLAIPHALDKTRRRELHAFLEGLAGGATLVLLGSRGEERWLAPATFEDNIHILEGLDQEAASDLADAVLRRARAEERREDSAFKDLMALLAGYPLAIQVVLPNLAAKPSAEVLNDLHQGLVEVDHVEPGVDPILARTRSLMACIDYSHGHLDPEAQALLACFAPFTGVIDTKLLGDYAKMLTEGTVLAGLPVARLGEVLEQARGLGLVLRDTTIAFLLHPQPALSWFLTQRLVANEWKDLRFSIETAFRKLYDGYAAFLSQLQESQDPHHQQVAWTVIEQEYPNLGTALRFAIQHRSSILSLFGALSRYLDHMQDHQRGLELGEQVLSELARLPKEPLSAEYKLELAGVIDAIAARQLAMRQLDLARATYQKALTMLNEMEGLTPIAAATLSASVACQLGVVATEQRRFDEAKENYEKALAIFTKLDHQPSLAQLYHLQGRLARNQRLFDQAKAAYGKALEINLSLGDRRRAAGNLHELGMVALEERSFAEAEAAHTRALNIFLEFSDKRGVAVCYRQLGIVAEQQYQLDVAKRNYQQALAIFLEIDDRYEAAGVFHQIGNVDFMQKDFEDAELSYQKALDLYMEVDDMAAAASVRYQMGTLAHERGLLDVAEANVEEALATFVQENDQYRAASSYYELGNIAFDQQRLDEAEADFEQALNIFSAVDAPHRTAAPFQGLGRIAEKRGQFAAAEIDYLKALEVSVAYKDMQATTSVMQNVAALWAVTRATSIPNKVAEIMRMDVREVTKMLEKIV